MIEVPVPQYVAKFVGHLVRWKPDNLPVDVEDYQMFEARNKEEIAANITQLMSGYIHGMAVRLKPSDMVDATKIQTKLFIPMHMIAYITCQITRLASDITINQEGDVHFADGTEVPKQ